MIKRIKKEAKERYLETIRTVGVVATLFMQVLILLRLFGII